MREVDARIEVTALPGLRPDGTDRELHDVDLIIGCVDHDGPRDRLNQIAIDTDTPYLDIATGLDTSTSPPTIAGRAVLFAPNGPCLHCLRVPAPAHASRT